MKRSTPCADSRCWAFSFNLFTGFRVSIFEQFVGEASPASGLDRFVADLVSVGAEGKAICLFPLLFGIGLAMKFDRMTDTRWPSRSNSAGGA